MDRSSTKRKAFVSFSVLLLNQNAHLFTSDNHAFSGLDAFETETGTEIKLGFEFPVFPHKLTAVITTEDSVEYSPVMFMNRHACSILSFIDL